MRPRFENLKPYRVRGMILEWAYIRITRAIWGYPKHDDDMVVGCKCGDPVCEAYRPVLTYLRLRSGIV